MSNLKPGPNARKRTGRRGDGRATSMKEIKAKRSNTTIGAIKLKVEDGTAHGKERASIRVGSATTRLLTGQEDLSTWDDEELRRGKKRDRNGRFQGPDPRVVSKSLHDELVKRTIAKAHSMMVENLEDAVRMLIEVVKGAEVEEKDRIKAIGMIMDRVMGKPQERVEVSGDAMPKWMVAIQQGIVTVNSPDVSEAELPDVIDADWSEED